MKCSQIGALALVCLFAAFSSFKIGDADLYWFHPGSTSYVTGSIVSPYPQDEVNRLNGGSSGPYSITEATETVIAEEGFLGDVVDEGSAPPAKVPGTTPSEFIRYKPQK